LLLTTIDSKLNGNLLQLNINNNQSEEIDNMLKKIQLSIISLLFITFSYADVFMTELTDPQNSSDAGRYV